MAADPRRRIQRMTDAIGWVRKLEGRYAILEAAGLDRYVQFANLLPGNEGKVADTAGVALPQPALVLAAAVASGVPVGSVDLAPAPLTGWAAHGPWFGEPGHESLVMEVGSGLWPGCTGPALAADNAAVARLAAMGLTLGGGRHACLNFCRFGVTEPSDILAALADEILVNIAGAQPAYRLHIKRGHFTPPSPITCG